MKVLLGFMFLSLFIGTFWDRQMSKRYLLPVLGLSILVAIGYFFFNQT